MKFARLQAYTLQESASSGSEGGIGSRRVATSKSTGTQVPSLLRQLLLEPRALLGWERVLHCCRTVPYVGR
jgi:hypothetical protein